MGFFKSILFGEAGILVRAGRAKILREADLLPLPSEIDPRTSAFRADKVDWSSGRRLVWSLIPASWGRLRNAYLCNAVAALLGLAQPILVHRFVGSVSLDLGTQEAFLTALTFALALGLSSILRGTLIQHFFYGGLVSYQWIASATNEKIFRHSLKMTPAARLKIPVGDVVNHMSSDAESVGDFTIAIADLFYAVAVVIGVIGMLCFYLGWTAIAPVILLVLLAPLTRWIARRFSRLEEDMMRERDRRVTLMNQILAAIRVVKFFAWEKSVTAEVGEVRARELGARRRMARAEAFSTVTYVAVSSIVLFSALAVHAWRGFALDPALVFTCVSLFTLLEEPFGGLSWTLSRLTNAFVGGGRIAEFLKTETLSERFVPPPSEERAVGLRADALLRVGGFSLQVRAGESVALVGPVGSGKSTLLGILLGEDPADREGVWFTDGQGARVSARTAYVPQEAYIINGSLRENMEFGSGSHVDAALLRAAVAASFEKDLRDLPAGLATEIGEKGVNLSGGQKQRVSLARAVLRDPQIVFLDDPLSAVDVETEKRLCDRLLFGAWKDRTRIVATHRLESLRRFDRILFLENGRVTAEGTFAELEASSPRFRAFIRDHDLSHGTGESAAGEEASPTAPGGVVESTVGESRITEDEEREVGAVKSHVYANYFRSLGGEGTQRIWNLTVLLVGAVVVMGLPLAQRWWLGASSSAQQGAMPPAFAVWLAERFGDQILRDPLTAVFIYGVIGLLAIFLGLGNTLMWTERGIRAGQLLHDRMLRSMLGATVRFFDSTPVGRILQRFSRDVESVDIYLQRSFEQAVHILIEVSLCLALIFATVPWSLAAIGPVLLIYYFIQRDYRRPAREVKRLDAIARSPRYAHFKETLVGLPVIRGFGREDYFLSAFFDKLAHSQRMFYSHYLLNRWFSSRVPLIGGLIAVATTVSIVFAVRAGSLNAGVAGVLTIYMLSFWGYLNWGIRVFADIESRMISVERLWTYANLPQERETVKSRAAELAPTWPPKGALQFEEVTARYAPHLPLVLKGVGFRVEGGQRIGLIGRTGSGKSTLFQVLFRFLELESGRILIDGEDIATVPLHRLRRALAIIPQDPTLFMGTIRSNLDRYGEYGEEKVIAALKRSLMWDFVSRLPDGLDAPVAENGLNLSQGQRQLLCLARALLTGARVIVLDEATASVDVETDALLQRVIHEGLTDATLLIIAHRLGTVADCHKIIELAEGRVVAELRPNEAARELEKIEETRRT